MRRAFTWAVLLTDGIAGAGPTHAQNSGPRFEITITNLTRSQTFTPVFAATHIPGVRLFELGQPALPQLAILAEEGDVAPLMAVAAASPFVLDSTFTGPPPGGFVGPGQSRTITLRTRGGSSTSPWPRC